MVRKDFADRHQNVTSSSFGHVKPFRKISSTSVYDCLNNLADRQTNKKRTDKPCYTQPSSAEVKCFGAEEHVSNVRVQKKHRFASETIMRENTRSSIGSP